MIDGHDPTLRVAADWTNLFLIARILDELKGVNKVLERAFNQQEGHYRGQTWALTEDQ